jgi:hypothetical protein
VIEQEERPPADGMVGGDPVGSGYAEDAPAGGGQAAIDLALQVANVAALVSAAMRSADQEKRDELEARLALAQARLLEQKGTPEGLILFLAVMRGLLRGEDMSAQAGDLPAPYRAVYAQLMDEAEADGQEGTLTVREVLDEVTHNVILALVRGNFDQRRRMADTLLVMEQESRQRPDLAGLRHLLQAARLLLKGADPTPVASRLRGPFKARWEEILEAIQET